MSENDSVDIRSTAELLINNTRTMSYRGGMMNQVPPNYDLTRTHSINLISEDFLGGYSQDGRMSVVRRFFCLFVTFDLFFCSLLWLICIMINGDNIFQAFQKQILHYSIYTSLFDVVAIAICRFVVLLLFYAVCYVNHWFIIAFSTSCSCMFLISKVFVYDWLDSKQQVFEVILIVTSFVLAWGEAWFFDCRVIPQERYARRYFSTLTSSDRSPLMAPFLTSHDERRPPDSVANFYSPFDSAPNSDDEDNEDEDYRKMGLVCVQKVYDILQSTDWKVEKVTSKKDTIQSIQREKLGKIYKLTGLVKYPAKELMHDLFYKIEDMPKWNPTLLESKIVRKINSYTDITYQASVGGGGGIIKSRDFVNLRSWRLMRNGEICDDDNETEVDNSDDDNNSCEGSVSTVSDGGSTPLPGSVGSSKMFTSSLTRPRNETSQNPLDTLSKSLGAKGFETAPHIDFEDPPPLEDQFEDAKDNLDDLETSAAKSTAEYGAGDGGSVSGKESSLPTLKDKVWISAAASVEYSKVPTTSKYQRGQNLVTGFALRPVAGKRDACIFEWILCLDLQGYIPRVVLNTTYTTFMADYMTYLRKHVNELREMRKRVPRR